MYFNSRTQAGQKLAAELLQYYGQNAVVVALSEGAVIVGQQIAETLSCPLTLLLTKNIRLPGETQPIGTLIQDGTFAYNSSFSDGEIDEYYAEFHSYIEDQKREKFDEMNRLLADGGVANADMLRDRIVILVSDGLKSGLPLDGASLFLKPVRLKRLIIATPIASVPAVDRMHILADELHCLGVTENYLSTSHYYEQNDLPTHQQIIEILKRTAAD